MNSNPQMSGTQAYRPVIAPPGPPQNFGPPMPYPAVVQNRPPSQISPAPGQHFPSTGQGGPVSSVGAPSGLAQPFQYTQVRPSQPLQAPPSQGVPMPQVQLNMTFPQSNVLPQQTSYQPNVNMSRIGGTGAPLSSSYTFATSYNPQQNGSNPPFHYHPVSQAQVNIVPSSSASSQTLLPSVPPNLPLVTPVLPPGQNPSVSFSTFPTTLQVNPPALFDWIEHTSADGKRYYYNRKTKQSSWEKPFELMTPIERADASTDWREFTTPEGRKYYYNKVTKASKWIMPDELKLAREKVTKAGVQQPTLADNTSQSLSSASLIHPVVELSPALATLPASASSTGDGTGSSQDLVKPLVDGNPVAVTVSESPSNCAPPSELLPISLEADTSKTSNITPLPMSNSGAVTNLNAVIDDSTTASMAKKPIEDSVSSLERSAPEAISAKDSEETRTEEVNGADITTLQDKLIDEEPMPYANKQEAKAAFIALLESANVRSDSTWEQAMRVIINDKRYGALKSLGERKQAFNEYLTQRKKLEAEERRTRNKKARENFTAMLEECKDLSSSTKWSKAIQMFENDDRFNAVERPRDREDLFESHMAALQKKERARLAEEHKRNVSEYKAFLRSCDFIKANSQWRKLHDRLEVDERCLRLEKLDRLKIFEEYVQELEKEEEERKRVLKDQLRREERQNRDDFRKLMEEHVANGTLTAKTHWRDYCLKVKDIPAYLAVASNTSGATPKDLFEDVAEELEKQYIDDKEDIKAAMKMGKVILTLKSTFEEFKAAVSDVDGLHRISEVNLKVR